MRTSVNMPDKLMANLEMIAEGLGVEWNGKPSWRAMLTKIAKGELVVSRPKSQHVFDAENYSKLVSAVPAGPKMIPASVPAWNAPVAKGEFVTERDDGYFVDTEEFDKPVPQRQVPAAVEAFAGIFGMKAEVAPIPQYANKEEKLAALEKLGLKKGSAL